MTASVVIYCDSPDGGRSTGCIAQVTTGAPNLVAGRQYAERHGWRHTRDDHDLCPRHSGRTA